MKKKLFIIIPIVVFVIAIFAGAYIIKQPTFLFPSAQGYNISGTWNIAASITSPMAIEMTLPADFVQHNDGTVTGVVIDPDTGDERSATGRIEGNQLSINDLHESGTQSGISYEVVISFRGTVSEDNNRIDGTISGRVIKPMSVDISGTMAAVRTGAPPPTQPPTYAPTQPPTHAPTQPPVGGNTTPVPTATAQSQGRVPYSFEMGFGARKIAPPSRYQKNEFSFNLFQRIKSVFDSNFASLKSIFFRTSIYKTSRFER